MGETKKMDLPKDLWVKSETEVQQEKEGFKLFSNYDPAFSHGGRVKLVLEMHDFIDENRLSCETRILREAYDHLTCGIPHGGSYYIKEPERIIPERVVIRNWQAFEDRPYEGDDVEEILANAERCSKIVRR